MKNNEKIKLSKHNIMEFEGLKKAKKEIADKYLATINYKSKSAIYAIVCMVFFVIGVVGFCSIPTLIKNAELFTTIAVVVISCVSTFIAISFLVIDVLDREKILYAQRGIPYIAECYIYDKQKVVKKDKNGKEIEYYNVKVEDIKGKYLTSWYSVDKTSFESTENPLVLIVFDYESKKDFDVRTKKSLGIKDVKSQQIY